MGRDPRQSRGGKIVSRLRRGPAARLMARRALVESVQSIINMHANSLYKFLQRVKRAWNKIALTAEDIMLCDRNNFDFAQTHSIVRDFTLNT